MPNQELLDFIKKSKEAGQRDEEIKQALKSAGWQEEDIEEGLLLSATPSMLSAQPTAPAKPAQNYSSLLYGSVKQEPAFITSENKSNKKLIAAIVVIFILLAGAASAYYFKDELKSLPVISDLIKKDEPAQVADNSQQPEQQPAADLPGVGEDEVPPQPKQSLIPSSSATPQTTSQFKCKLPKDENYIIVSGKVVFPKGVKNTQNYEVVGYNFLATNPEADGSFCIYVGKGTPKTITIASPDKDAFVLVTMINSKEDVSGIIIDAKSTASALLTISFVSLRYTFEQNAKIIEVTNNNADVAKLAEEINKLDNLKAQDLKEGGRLMPFYNNAVDSLRKEIFG